MNRTNVRLSGVLPWLAVLCGATPAHAHQPYVQPIAEVVAPEGRKLRLEILFGDGILSQDPGRGQLRAPDGKVVGRTPVGRPVSGFCESSDPATCRIIVGCGPFFPNCVWTPDVASVDWEARTFVGNSNHRTGDPYPEYDAAPAPVGFARDLRRERADASLLQLPFMFAYTGPLLAFALVVGSWWGAVYATRRARLAELRWRGGTAGSRVLGVVLWFAVVVLALPVLLWGTLFSYWNMSFWLTAFLIGCAIALLRRAERRFFPLWLQAWREAESEALPSAAERTSLPLKGSSSPP